MRKKAKILEKCLGKSCFLRDMVEYSPDSVVSKTILEKTTGTITLFSFDKGQGLSEHTSPYDAVVQVLEGTADRTIDGEKLKVGAGELIIMPAEVPHAVLAEEKFKMLLILIRA